MNELKAIYGEVQPKIYAYFYAKTSSQVVAEDLTHDVFYEACKVIHSFAGHSTLQTWLFAIAKNVLRNYYRSNTYKQNLSETLKKQEYLQEQVKTPEDMLVIAEEVDQLLLKIQQLDDLEKEIVIMRIYGELSFKEIGQLVKRSENYTRVTFHRTKLKLQKEMRREND